MSAPQTRPSVPARRSGSGTHHAARSRGHRLAARLRAVGAPVGVRAHPRCLLHPHGARRRCRASRRPRAAPRLSRAPLLAQGLPLSSLLSVAARTACGHSEWYLHIRSTPRDPWTSLHCARGNRERDRRDNALFERIDRLGAGSQLTHEWSSASASSLYCTLPARTRRQLSPTSYLWTVPRPLWHRHHARRIQITARGSRPVVDGCGHANVPMSLRGASGHGTPPRHHTAIVDITGMKSVHTPVHSRHAGTQQHAKGGPDQHTQNRSMRSISGRRWSRRGAGRASRRPTHGQSGSTPWCPGAAASSKRRRPSNS